jgi:hypothetical protein
MGYGCKDFWFYRILWLLIIFEFTVLIESQRDFVP